jgi:O-antigen/teichoic acid export membrane protein
MGESVFNKSFIGNLIYAFTAQGVSLLLSFANAMIIPKILGVSDYAYWQLFIFYISYSGFFALGIGDGLYLRFGGKKYEQLDYVPIGNQLRLFTIIEGIFGSLFFAYALLFIADEGRMFVIASFGIYLPLGFIVGYLGLVFQMVNKTKIYSKSILIEKIASFILLIILLLLECRDYRLYILINLVARLGSAFYLGFLGRDFLIVKFKVNRVFFEECIENIKVGLNLMSSNISSMLIIGSGRLIIDKIWGVAQFGLFSFSLTLTNFVLQFITQISMVLFPTLRAIDPDSYTRLFSRIRNILVVILPTLLLFFIPLKYLITLWLPQYAESIDYLGLLLPICVFDGKMNLLCNTFFKVLREEKKLLLVNVGTMLLSIIMCWISGYLLNSFNGIIFSLVISVTIRSVVSEIIISRILKINSFSYFIAEFVLVFSFIVFNILFNDIAAYSLFIIVYMLFMFYYRKVFFEILNTIKNMVPFFKSKNERN